MIDILKETVCECGHTVITSGCSTGYGMLDGKKTCYACVEVWEKAEMAKAETKKWTMYLMRENGRDVVCNWPSSIKLVLPYGVVRKGKHNLAGSRYDVWFSFAGANWHGVNYGENSQILHCKNLVNRKGK